jgi:pyruvate,orthophosphate dikinase
MERLEKHYRDMCDIEFTIERGRLWFLQTRVGKRTSFAEWVMAFDMVGEGLITPEEGLLRLDPNRLEQLFKPVIREDQQGSERPATRGLNASPGAAVGRVVFTADAAQEWAERGEQVILVRRETTPDDYHGMIRSQGILTSAGGTNSHAAVVARGEGIPAVCGADQVRIERGARAFTVGSERVGEGDWITIDGTDGAVYLKRLELDEPALARARRRSGRRSRRSCSGPTRPAGSGCGPTPTPPTRPVMPELGGRRASGSAAPSTCSWGRSGWRRSER